MSKKQRIKEAETTAMLFEEEVKKGNYLDGEKITLTEFVGIWMREYAEKELAPSTLVKYKMRLETRVLPALGHMKLAKIQPNHITAFYNNLAETGIRKDSLYKATDELLELIGESSNKSLSEKTGLGRNIFARLKSGGNVFYDTTQTLSNYFESDMEKLFIEHDAGKVLAPKTLRHHHTLLSGIFSLAMEWNLIKDNPTQRVRLPSVTKAKSAKANFYDDEQVAVLLAALEDEPIKYRTILYVALDTGLRASEVTRLTWGAIDLEQQTINVVQQRQYVPGYGILEVDPKTDSGVRVVTLSSFATQKLKEYKTHQLSLQCKCGTAWYEGDIVFTHEDGTPIFPHRPSQWFTEFIRRKELPHITFHGLRHTNASLLIGSSVDIVTLSGRLGHSSKNVTLDIYSHMIKSREKLAANQMDNFYNTVGDNT